MKGLIWGEIYLTFDIILGLIIGNIIIRLRLSDIIMKHLLPRNIPPVTGLAVAISAGSSKAGAAIIASSLLKHEISERQALWSVLMLPLPSYLRRWPSTFALSVSMAGKAGAIFALSLLVRSIARFMIALHFLRREGREYTFIPQELEGKDYTHGLIRNLMKTLPTAWIFFALSYLLSPVIDAFFRDIFAGNDTFLPVSGWSVAAGSIAHVSAALSLAGGAMSSGELGTMQAAFALILGSGLGTASRIMRQNAGYYFGLFPKNIASKMLLMNFATIIPLIMVNLIFAGLALSLWT